MIKKFVYVSGGNIIRQGITLLSQLLLARSLGEGAFGDLTLAFAWFQIMVSTADLGTRIYSWRRVAVAPEGAWDEETVRLFWTRSRLTLSVALLLNVAIALLAHGRLGLLLHLYTVALVINQATFDWVFLARGRFQENFGFTVVSGLLYMLGIVYLVSRVERAPLVPLIFAASYGLPGLFYLLRTLKWRLLLRGDLVRGIGLLGRVVAANWQLFFYDLLQRACPVAILLVASPFYSRSDIAQFRVPQLLYAFVAAVGVYLAASLFSEVARDSAERREPAAVAKGVTLLVCLFLPLGISGTGVLAAPLSWFLGNSYPQRGAALSVLVACMLPAALAHFAREMTVASGNTALAMRSYIATIAFVALALTIYHPPDVAYLAYVLVAGEVVGLALVTWRHVAWYLTRGVLISLVVSALMGIAFRQVWYLIQGAVANEVTGYVVGTSVIGAVAAGYVFLAMRGWRFARR